jgi:hypothetical protein
MAFWGYGKAETPGISNICSSLIWSNGIMFILEVGLLSEFVLGDSNGGMRIRPVFQILIKGIIFPMKPVNKYKGQSLRFWAHVKFLSERIGYSTRKTKIKPSELKHYTLDDAAVAFEAFNLSTKSFGSNNEFIASILEYMNYRANILNNVVSKKFMTKDEAKSEFDKLHAEINPKTALLYNKQKGDKRHPAYLACMVQMIAEKQMGEGEFVNDAQNLSIVTKNEFLEMIFSRRFDGAYPSIINPKAVWEIKEYYGTTTFGSRVADGVYESLLDGFEISLLKSEHDISVSHYLFIDDRYTWWECGKSYLCRLVDMLHTGHVDEIFFGREVLADWGKTLELLKKV